MVGPLKNISSFRLCPEFDQVETRGGAKVKDKSRAKLHAALPGQVGGGEDEEKDDAWAITSARSTNIAAEVVIVNLCSAVQHL